MVSVQIAHEDAPLVGKGRWACPDSILKDCQLAIRVKELGLKAEKDISVIKQSGRYQTLNPQRTYHKFITAAMDLAREREHVIKSQARIQKSRLERAIDNTAKDSRLSEVEQSEKIAQLKSELRRIKQEDHATACCFIAAKDRLEGETVSKYYFQVNKESKPRDMIHALEIPEPPMPTETLDTSRNQAEAEPPLEPQQRYEQYSPKMAEMMCEFHGETLQNDGLDIDEEVRTNVICETLKNIEVSPTEENKEHFIQKLTRDEALKPLKLSKNDSAPGINGATNKFFKVFNNRYIEEKQKDLPAFDIVRLLTEVFNDIEEFRVDESTNFTEGWMCPIYKKNDRNRMSNYCLITLLNSEYKLLTKALSIKLVVSAPELIHKDQAGFIPGHQITNQTKLICMIIDHADLSHQNGLIVALDQEKAYDKIHHDYLWKVLEAFQIPSPFIAIVKSLYEHAQTRVMVNGFLSSPFKVTCGVRQGDPLSCLLFDLAIEPLVEMLRCSGLKGLSVPGSEERLIANLFADDTTTFLHEDDNLEDLMGLLENWCLASGAQFNVTKTKIIPIGDKDFRKNLINSRKTKEEFEPIPENIHIVEENEAIRILGAWFGNDIPEDTAWAPILEKIDQSLTRWEMSHTSVPGCRIIIQTVIRGPTQYLTAVQGMPKHIEDKLEKRERKFIWEGKTKNLVDLETLKSPRSQGGLDILDIRA